MQVSEMSRIEKSVRISAPRARVWRALTDAAEFGKWFGCEIIGRFQPGARVLMKHPKFTADFPMDVQQMVPEHTFSWRWHPGMPDPAVDYSKEPTTLVEFHLDEVEGGTLLTVVESGFDRISLDRRAGIFAQNEGGWAYQMKAIEAYAGKTS